MENGIHSDRRAGSERRDAQFFRVKIVRPVPDSLDPSERQAVAGNPVDSLAQQSRVGLSFAQIVERLLSVENGGRSGFRNMASAWSGFSRPPKS